MQSEIYPNLITASKMLLRQMQGKAGRWQRIYYTYHQHEGQCEGRGTYVMSEHLHLMKVKNNTYFHQAMNRQLRRVWAQMEKPGDEARIVNCA